MEPAETAVTRFTRGHFSVLIQKDAGGEAVLYAAKHDIHGNVMVKVFTSPNKYSEQEVRTLVKVICHQNIVRLLGTFYFEDGTDAMRSGYVMEFMANGSLHAVIHDLSIKYNDSQVYSWIQQAGRGIAYLHSQNIIHRDVNTRNMLLGETIDVLKISDFGLAKPDATTTEKNTCLMGTIVYMAPEVIDDQRVNTAADVYSLGISTWEIFHRKKPYYEHDSLSLFSLGKKIITGTRPKIELSMEEEMKNLVLRSLEAEYTLRPKASDFTTIAVKLGSEINVSPNAQKRQMTFAKRLTSPSRPLVSEIQNFFDSKLTLMIGGSEKYKQHINALAFEHNTKTWIQLDVRIPEFLVGAVVLDEELYAFFGDELGLFKLNPENRSWIKLIHVPHEIGTDILSTTYRRKIYVVERNGQCQTVFAYDPVANSWSELAPFKDQMMIGGITVLNSKLYIFGTYYNIRNGTSVMEAGYYDFVDDKWTYLTLDGPAPSLSIPATTYKNELVFLTYFDVCMSSLVETSVKTLPPLKSWRGGVAVFTCGNSLFVAGGHEDLSSYSNKVESFDGMTWTEMPRMPYGLADNATVTATGDLAKQLMKWSCVTPNAQKRQKAFAQRRKMAEQFADLLVTVTSPSRPLLLEIHNSFDSELTLLIGGIRDSKCAPGTLLAFEHNTKTWIQLDLRIPDFVSEAVVLGEELYVFGEESLHCFDLFKLNPENRSWIKLTDIPDGRNPMFFKSVAYRSKIYVFWIDTVYAYDPVANSWSELAPIIETMFIEGITVLNNKLYIFGRGRDSLMEVGYYDTVENEWTYLNLDVPVRYLNTPVTYKNELVFFDYPEVYASNLAETSLKTLPRLNFWRFSAAVFTCGNSLFVAGGHEELGDDSRCSDKVESFDGMTWTEMPRMPYGHTAFTTITATGDLAKQLLKWSC